MKKQNKILIITNDFYPSRGGIQECIMGLATSFGENATVFAPYYSGYDIRRDTDFQFITLRTNGLRQDRIIDRVLFIFFRRPFVFLFRNVRDIINIVKTNRISYIVCGHITNISVVIFIRKKSKAPIGVIIYGRELFFRGILKYMKRIMTRFLLSQVDKIFISGSFMKNILVNMSIPEYKIEIIRYGIKFSKDESIKIHRERRKGKIILTAGRLVERKGHSAVIKSMPMVLRIIPDVTYKIVGKGQMEKRLRVLVKEKNLSNYVEFCGEVENLVPYYNDCDVFVMPSRYIKNTGDIEGFGLVFLEANFFGKPVIGGRSGGVTDAIIDGVTGLLVDPENPEEIANAIIELLENPELARKLGEQGRKRVLEEFTWERAARIIESEMREVIKRKKKL